MVEGECFRLEAGEQAATTAVSIVPAVRSCADQCAAFFGAENGCVRHTCAFSSPRRQFIQFRGVESLADLAAGTDVDAVSLAMVGQTPGLRGSPWTRCFAVLQLQETDGGAVADQGVCPTTAVDHRIKDLAMAFAPAGTLQCFQRHARGVLYRSRNIRRMADASRRIESHAFVADIEKAEIVAAEPHRQSFRLRDHAGGKHDHFEVHGALFGR